MATVKKFRYTAGLTALFAYPASASYPLTNPTYTNVRVQCSELSPGFYSVTVDESLCDDWSVFEGAGLPISHDDAVVEFTTDTVVGDGPLPVTIPVTLGGQPVEGASVSVSKAGLRFSTKTNALGQAKFSLESGTWTVAISASGAASFTPVSLVIPGAIPTYDLTPLDIVLPTSVDESTGIAVCKRFGAPVVEAVFVRMIAGPGQVGIVQFSDQQIKRSGVDGVVQFNNLQRGARFQFGKVNDTESVVEFVVPEQDWFYLPELL